MQTVCPPIVKILSKHQKLYEELFSQPYNNLNTYCLPILFEFLLLFKGVKFKSHQAKYWE